MLHTTVITVKQTVINGVCDNYKWYHTQINANCMINFNMYSHTWNLNPVNSRPRPKPYQLCYEYNYTYLQPKGNI